MEKWNISSPRYESDILNESLRVSPWQGHRNFVYDYFKYIKPKTVIELGTHYGCSFFAMCQSVKDNQLDSELYAVDTWEGDPQAGFYGNEVWDTVIATKHKYFEGQNTVFMKMLFNEAVKKFSDETFDLIHIDGLHTYEAVSEDFHNWLPKLKKDGVILFHDVDSEKKYGTNVFWEETKQKYPCFFEFSHSWGLGILFPKGSKIYELLMQNNFQDKLWIYRYKALYEYETIKTEDLTKMADERYEAIMEQSRMIDERDSAIASQKNLIDEKDEGMRSQSRMIDERDAVIAGQKAMIDEKDEGMRNQSRMIDERDAVIAGQKALIDEKDEGMRNQGRMIDERDALIAGQKALIDEKDEGMRNQGRMIDERDAVIAGQKALIDEKDEGMRNQGRMIDERDAVIAGQKALIDEKDEGMRNQGRMIDERDAVVRDQRQIIEEQTARLEHLSSLLQKVKEHKMLSRLIFRGEA